MLPSVIDLSQKIRLNRTAHLVATNMHIEHIVRLGTENERLWAAIKEAQEAIEQHKIKGPGSVDFDGILARLRDALGRRLCVLRDSRASELAREDLPRSFRCWPFRL